MKGQIQVTFSWLYILIAGAVILMFFVGIVVKHQASAEDSLTFDVTRIMESILVAASKAEKTMQPIETKGLSRYTFFFGCEEGVGNFGIEGSSSSRELSEPLFSPRELKSSKMIAWSLPYYLPFKVTDLLMLTSENTAYFITGRDPFTAEFIEAAGEQMTVEEIDPDQIDVGGNFQVRIIDTDGSYFSSDPTIDHLDLADDKVTGVGFQGSTITFYQKLGRKWRETGTAPLISSAGEKDTAKYAAVFAADYEIYTCNMNKVFKQLQMLNRIYAGKTQAHLDRYLEYNLPEDQECINWISQYPGNLKVSLSEMEAAMATCLDYYDDCDRLTGPSQRLELAVERMDEKSCTELY